MRTLGYAQHFGVGIQIARDALARNGNPPPEFRVEPRTIIATIRTVSNKRSRKRVGTIC
jgi:ATP-dependent DNA helicase RecG